MQQCCVRCALLLSAFFTVLEYITCVVLMSVQSGGW